MPENNRKIELSPSLNAGLGIHKFYFPRAFFSKDLKEIVEPLLAIFNNDSGFPLYIQDNVEYYPSVTSTILIALYHTRMIDDEFKNRIQTTIFNLKTRTDNKTKKERNPEDVAAWDVSEGANCWTTSMVIESLLETGYSGNGIDEIKEAILWLKDQQKDDGGWGFDRICISKVFFTARVMYALHLGKRLFNPECSQSRDLERSLLMGEDFIKNKVRTGFNIYYWPDEADDNKPDPTNTIIALWILNKLNKLDKDIKIKSLNYLRMDLHNKDIWDFRAIIKENNTKYGSHKIITSFTPSIPLVLLELGVEPFDELCTKPIYWLKNNFDNGWNLPVYGERGLTFVYALGLWTILAWNREIMNRMICSSFENNILVNLRKRIKLLLITILSLLILISRDYLFNLVYFIIIYVYNYYAKNDIFTFLATFITIVSGLIAIPKGLSILDKKYLNCACEGKIKDVADELMRRLYLK